MIAVAAHLYNSFMEVNIRAPKLGLNLILATKLCGHYILYLLMVHKNVTNTIFYLTQCGDIFECLVVLH